MASAQRFALEYVQNGRDPLECYLCNPLLVVTELRKRKIVSEKEVRKVKSYKKRCVRTKVLLDVVISRGEVASYEFLKILYETRHQTLPTHQRQGPDLHQWISCFSFTEDPDIQSNPASELGPCERYRRQLNLRAKDVVQAKWERSMNFLKDEAKSKPFTYIPLVLDTDKSDITKIKSKAYKKPREKKLKTYIPRDKGKLCPDHLLKTNEKNILLVGKPGIGKTTVVEQVLSIWSENERYKGSYVFYFDEPTMRSMSHSAQPSTLRSLLFDRCVTPQQGTEDEVLRDIEQNSENVTLVFDGIMDEIGNPVLRAIMKKDILSDAKVLITCRPEAEDCEFLLEWPSYRVEVKGFSDESIHAYFKWMLGTTNDRVCGVLNNLAVFSLCHVPMYAFIVIACIAFNPSEANNHPCTITEMYVQIFRHCMKRHGDQNVEHLDKYIHDNKGEIKFMAMNSYQALLQKTVNLTGLDCKDSVQQAFLSCSSAKDSSASPSSSFLHNTMQEFWAALFLLMTPDQISYVLQRCQTEDGKYLKYIVSFLCGLLSSSLIELIRCVVSEDQIRDISASYTEKVLDTFLCPHVQQDLEGSSLEVAPENLLFACQCLYEHQSPEACLLLLQKVDFELDLCEEQLDPQQCCAVSYVINQSTALSVSLYLDDSSLSDRGMKLILGSLENIQFLRMDHVTQCQMWKVALHPDTQTNFDCLLRLCEYEMHLSVEDQDGPDVFRNAGEVLKQRGPEEVELRLHLARESQYTAEFLGKGIFDSLPNIKTIRFVEPIARRQSFEARRSFQLDLLLHGAIRHQETGQKCVEDLQRVLPMTSSDSTEDQSVSVMFLYQRVKVYEKNEGATILPSLLPIFCSIPAVWHINMGDRKIAALLEVLMLTDVKKPVELEWSDDECEMRNLLQCLPFISQLRFNDYILIQHDSTKRTIEGLLTLFQLAKQRQDLTGEETLNMLLSVCSYPAFPWGGENKEDEQSEFLLSLYSSAVAFEFEPKDQILSGLKSVFQSAPAVWALSGDKTLVLLEVLKLTGEKRPVRLKDPWWTWPSESIKQFIRCLPYISQLCVSPQDDEWTSPGIKSTLNTMQKSCLLHLCGPDALNDKEMLRSLDVLLSAVCFTYPEESPASKFLLDLYSQLSCDGQEMDTPLALSLLRALNFTITLSGWLPSVTCKAVGSLLGRSPPGAHLNVTLTPLSISLQGAHLLFKQVKELHKLKTNEMSTLKLTRLARSKLIHSQLVVEELALVFSCPNPSESVLCRVLSSLDLLLRAWKVKILDLRDCPIDGYRLTALLCHEGALTVRLSRECLQQLALTVHEAKDKELTRCFLEKIDRDLSGCTLDWNMLHSLLADATQPVSANLRRIRVKQRDIPQLLPLLSNVRLQRMNGHFMRTALRAIYQQRAGHLVNPLVKSSDEWINLSNLVLDHEDCDALRFALDYSDGVKLNLLWTVVPAERMENIFHTFTLHRISELRVDRRLLLELLHACAGFRTIKSAAAALLGVLHHKLDLSCSSAVDLVSQEEERPLCLSPRDCRTLASAIQEADGDTELDLNDCQVDSVGLEELLSVLNRVQLRLGKSTLLQFLHVVGDKDGLAKSTRFATSLSRALGQEVDLSETRLDLRACSSLALVLEYSEGLSKLDLSHCHLEDEHLDCLLPHLHKAEVLNLCNNQITHEGAVKLNLYMVGNSLTQTVCLLTDRLDYAQSRACPEPHDLGPTPVKMESSTVSGKTIKDFDPSIKDDTISYRYCFSSCGSFRCSVTGLVFWMRGAGSVEYRLEHWDERILGNSGYEPAGPLYNIRSPERQMYQLDLPHSETDVYAAENLSVVHLGAEREFLVPKRVTCSHVSVDIDSLSLFGPTRKTKFFKQYVQGQVLFFLEPEVTVKQLPKSRLWVFLLPRSVPLSEVEKHNKEYKYVKTSSNCVFRPKAKYSVDSDLKQGFLVQPKKYTFTLDYNSDQHATFEVFLNRGITDLQVRILEKTGLKMRKRWCRQLILKTLSAANGVSRVSPLNQQQQWTETLGRILEELSNREMKKLKGLMNNTAGRCSISRCALEKSEHPCEIADLMLNAWGLSGSILATQEFMRKLPRNDSSVTSLLEPFVVQAKSGCK